MRSSMKFLVVSVALLTAGLVFAGQGGWGHGPGWGPHGRACKDCPYRGYHHPSKKAHGNLFLDYADDLGLSDKQVVKLNKLRLEKHEKKMALKHKKYEAKAELMELAHSEKPDRKKIKKLADQIGEIKGEMIELKYITLLNARDVLTEKQRKKLDEMYSKFRPGPPDAEGEKD